jgi:hypothetical protein
MQVITLSVHHRRQRVFAHYVKSPQSPNDGGMLVTVYSEGSFLGLSFAALLEMGTGRHEISECNERDFQNLGKPPQYADEREKRMEWFEEVLFGHQQGAFTSGEVLAVADRVLKAQRGSS